MAQKKSEYNSTAKGRQLKISNDYAFADFVETKVNYEKYSFYAVLQLAKDKFNTSVCLRTLYNYFYNKVLNIKASHLPYKSKRKTKTVKTKRVYQFDKRSIETRPNDILNRDVFGHWEMDTVVSGKGDKACLLVLTERFTRIEIIRKMYNKECCNTWKTLEQLKSALKDNFAKVFKTITCDNGVEFSTNYDFKDNELKEFVRTNLYYCHPYSSYERGSNETQNRFIRRFIPKGTHISDINDSDISRIESYINNYPRKMFGGLSSFEYFNKYVCL